jgi:LmbE family N-acetylglucosaminyl deacetylase
MTVRSFVPARALAAPGLLLGLAILGSLATGARTHALPVMPAASSPAPPELAVDAGTRLLVISPHPDDETLCCAGAIEHVRRAGGEVSIVWVTSGDGSRLDGLLLEGILLGSPARMRALGERRMQEALEATTSLGVAAGRQLFLGYPDGGLSALLAGDGSLPRRSATSGASEVPYAQALFPGHPYTRASLESDLAEVLDRVRPTLILAPSVEDRHPDHRATGLIALEVLKRRGALANVRFWIVHGPPGWPAPRQLLEPLPLPAPPHGPGLRTLTLSLDADTEERKLTAISAYHTQMQMMSPFLLAFVRTNEVFFQAASTQPP